MAFRNPLHSSPEHVKELCDEIVALIQSSAYDDMPWPEVDRALQHASHEVKLLQANPEPVEPPTLPGGNGFTPQVR